MKKITPLCLLFIFSLLTIHAEGLIEKTLHPVDDTYTYSDGTIRGMEDLLRTYHSTAGSQFRRISFLKFDLRGLSPFIESAKLRLYCEGFKAGGDNAHQFDLYPVLLNSWAEDDVTFLNAVEKLGVDQTALLGSYIVSAGSALEPGWIEITGSGLKKLLADSLAKNSSFICFRMREKNPVKNATAAVVVDFHAKENASGFAPELIVVEKNVDNLKLSTLLVDGAQVVSFNENTYQYIYKIPYNTIIIPQVGWAPKSPTSSVTSTQATSLTGTLAQRTAKVTVSNGTDLLSYSVIFELLPPPTESRLSSIVIEEQPIDQFSKDVKSYLYYLPYTATVAPTIIAESMDPAAQCNITYPSNIRGTLEERTAQLRTSSADGTAQDLYQIEFVVLPQLDIFLAIGQSNMAGRAPYTDKLDPIEEVYLLTPSARVEFASNPLNKYSNIRKDLSVQGLGPSYTFALTMKEHLKRPIGLVVNAQGGSSITAWYQPGKSNYDASLLRAKQAQKYGKLKGIIWHQGSSDNSAGQADNFASYKKNLLSMVTNLRVDLNEPELFFVCGELSERSEFDKFSQYVVQAVASYIPYSDYIVTDDTNLLSDNIHFDAPSNLILGERYAQRIIENVYKQTSIAPEKKSSVGVLSTDKEGVLVSNLPSDTLCQIYTVSGVLVYDHILRAQQNKSIPLTSGLYIVYLQNDLQTQTTKLSIQ